MTNSSGSILPGGDRREARGSGTKPRDSGVGRAQVGQWYARWDKGEMFQVTNIDDSSKTVGVQTFDGDLYEIEEETWTALPLSLAEPPEDWTGPMDDVEVDDLGYSDTQMRPKDWEEPLQPLRVEGEDWEDAGESDESEPEDEIPPAQ